MLFSQKIFYMCICLSDSAVLWACFVLPLIPLPFFHLWYYTIHHTKYLVSFSVVSFSFLPLSIHYCFFPLFKMITHFSQLICSHFSVSYSFYKPGYICISSLPLLFSFSLPPLQTVSWGRFLRRGCCLVCRQRAPTQRKNQRWATISFIITRFHYLLFFFCWCLLFPLVKLSGLFIDK